ncbi:hypothetical protein FRACYDRAFT_235518 [Fragilariopsis cylindrus CCMP1102]|uniref:Uncharacterized protein n=1 Tax=Fragilariopsis cylindrus CCMP1102 TaxID=635003 RepID=A0A1E7FMW3_9STRA|nr:hypothetical protein FRACYDRAFT_235518 [Fragilariopsis cylindrus CCMP1102]|eukprot:OEU19464.1 hypothetical protein FRACYDRAFT_235518 [Fragilariopsis cylindrus CCMP1102]
MKDAATAAADSSIKSTRNSVAKTPSLIEIFSRAMSDCLDDEMVALNQDIKDDVFISGFKNLISVEFNYDEEFREDDNIIMGEGNRDYRQGNIPARKMKSNDDGGDDVSRLQSLVSVDQKTYEKNRDDTTTTSDAPSKNEHDDERSDFLIIGSKGQGIFNTMSMADIPSLIEFKPKKRRSRPNQYQHQHQKQQQQQDTTTIGSYNNGNSNKNRCSEQTTLEDHHGNQRQRMMEKNNDQHQHRHNQVNQNNQDITTNTTNTNTTASNGKEYRWRKRKIFYLLSFRNKNKD